MMNGPMLSLACAALAVASGIAALGETPPPAAKHWAFVPPVRLRPPAVNDRPWPRNPIDLFILARLERERLSPSPEADRVTLARRLSLDLIGLPPTPAEVDRFVNDRSPDAYEQLVDRLLASPHYGERWGRHWLDLARFADSNGYSIDAPRSIWKYRDWVIQALNRDLPFDQFTIEQLAGDLLPGATLDQKIATGFHRNTQINQEGGIDPEQFHVESVMDRVNTTGTAFLGLTIGCAQCHDHKFDPISQKEYYRFLAFFNNTVEDGHGKATPEGMLEIPGEFENPENLQKEWEETQGDLGRFLDGRGNEVLKWERSLSEEQQQKLKPVLREALKLSWRQRTISQKRAAYAAFRPDDPEFKSRDKKLSKLEKRETKPVTTLFMIERPEPRPSFVFIKGDFTRKGERVTPGVPAILPPLIGAEERGEGQAATPASSLDGAREAEASRLPNRLDLARWIVDPHNPLTARVIVNRVWQQYFGRGLVETENDFGTQGSPPTHPELLDWLAKEFTLPTPEAAPRTAPGAARAWSLKHLHRLIVTSATYRQSSHARSDLSRLDPNNRLLARQSRLRLDAEIVRDVGLKASGLFNDRIGGPSVFPPQPDGVMKLGQLKRDWTTSVGPERYRRGMYTHYWRATPHPALAVFDAPDAFSTCTRRLRSNTPLQALTLLNDQAFLEFARALALRVLREATPAGRIDLAFRLCLSRHPAPDEKQCLLALLDRERAAVGKAPPAQAGAATGAASSSPKPPEQIDPQQLAAWTTVSRVLLNLDETITRE